MSDCIEIQAVPQAACDAAAGVLQQHALHLEHADLCTLVTTVVAAALREGLVLRLHDHAADAPEPRLPVHLTLDAHPGMVGLAVYDAGGDYAADVYVEYYAGQLVARTWNWDVANGDDPTSEDVLLTRPQVETLVRAGSQTK